LKCGYYFARLLSSCYEERRGFRSFEFGIEHGLAYSYLYCHGVRYRSA
jgi:hypothetical protein